MRVNSEAVWMLSPGLTDDLKWRGSAQSHILDLKRAKMMLGILFLNLSAVRVFLACAMLSGCVWDGPLTSILAIRNDLPQSIYYCFFSTLPECKDEIKSGGVAREPYYTSSLDGLENSDMYGTILISVCGKPVDFERIRKVSPVIRVAKQEVEVVVDEDVYKAFCSE